MAGIAIVTGGGSGIGRATARGLARAGWRVTVAGRRLTLLEETCAEAPQDMIAVVADVTKEESVELLFAKAVGHFGRVDLLFNNAGMFPPTVVISEVELASWRTALDVNLTGAFLCARAAFRQMARQSPRGGRIINNGSLSAHVPRPGSAAYTATKHGMTGLTRSISLDGRPFGIACGQIDIGNAGTAMTACFANTNPQADANPAGEPMMDVADAAASVVHMASLPLEANVQFLTVMATRMAYIGRG